jgi:hypothetical protein
MAFRNVRLFLRTLMRFLRNECYASLSQTLSHPNDFERIDLTRGVSFVVSEADVKLMSVGAGGSEVMQSMTLSLDDTKQIFRSIERAYDRHEMVEIKLDDLSWKTDCRVRSNPDRVTVSFNGSLGRTRIDVRRQDIAAAIANFTNRFETK